MKCEQNILFLCNHNSARSQIAEGILESIGDPRFRVFSAGLEPRPLSEHAIRVMNEIGIDISNKSSKSIKQFLGREVVHHAIVLCAKTEADCPRLYPFANHFHEWQMPAPNTLAEELGTELEAFRKVRDLIDEKIREWIAELDRNAA